MKKKTHFLSFLKEAKKQLFLEGDGPTLMNT